MNWRGKSDYIKTNLEVLAGGVDQEHGYEDGGEQITEVFLQ